MMEFEDDHEEDEEEEEDNDDDDQQQQQLLTYKSTGAEKKPPSPPVRYRECLKNHAVGIGGHAVDGCGEFMPAGVEGTLDALKCAACNCHRNFHRKEPNPNNHQLSIYTPRPPPPPHHLPFQQPPVYNFYPYNRTTAATPSYLHVSSPRPLALPSPSSGGGGGGVREMTVDDGGGGSGTLMMTSSGRKRHRTKFNQEQKDKMLELAERLDWKIQKQDEPAVQQFINETGVKRHVLKVWMHNNKHTLGKKP